MTATIVDRPRNQPMAQDELQALSTFLTGKGLSSTQVALALGAAPGSLTRLQCSQNVIAVLKTLPKQAAVSQQ
jgi:hypothetical protein